MLQVQGQGSSMILFYKFMERISAIMKSNVSLNFHKTKIVFKI